MEEEVREKSRSVSILQVRTKYLEEENMRLQDRIDSITQQKHGLDKLLKEHKLGKDREVSLHITRHFFDIVRFILKKNTSRNIESSLPCTKS